MQLTPTQRRQYYERVLHQYRPGNTPEMTYSCNLLGRYLRTDYPEVKDDTRPFDKIIEEYFPEYHNIIMAMRQLILNKVIYIKAWPANAQGNIERCKALSEAIKIVSI